MKKIIMLICAIVFVMPVVFNICAQAGYDDDYVEVGTIQRVNVIDADKIPYERTPLNKLERGVINALTFWLELPAEVAKLSKERDPAYGTSVGMVNGTITGAVRLGTAGFDMATFLVPSYDKPIMKPEFAYQRADAKMRELFW
ncbi:MAG: exosortase system-associated protein, TIGR04073 family [Candidatus Omnitrophica bacterium]|nr:exosortase system-associated protein, TIGR04073 family [Candidatus Omnitrophota bacterium]